ncbi:MAG TPA: tetratricopeptide repeat protein [Sphingomicrobium sp.]|nr:tetratricopeptide repeat protein [Sphingomicrobium sp.]
MHCRFLVLSFSAAALAATAAPAFAQQSDGYSGALALFHAGKFREAIAALDEYIPAHPNEARALVLRGDSQASLQNNREALKDYDAALQADPQYQYGYVTRCETRLQVDDNPGALADCEMAVKLNPSDTLAYEDRGDVQFQREAYDLALADYDKAVSLGRSSAYLFGARCDSERLTRKLDLAKADCEKSLTLDPKSRRGLWAAGRLALAEKRYDDAVSGLTAYIAQKPDASDTAYYFRGLANNRLKNYGSALADLNIYVQRVPDDGDGYKERAVALYGSGDKKAAAEDLSTAKLSYTKAGDQAEAARVAAMIDAMSAGRNPTP